MKLNKHVYQEVSLEVKEDRDPGYPVQVRRQWDSGELDTIILAIRREDEIELAPDDARILCLLLESALREKSPFAK